MVNYDSDSDSDRDGGEYTETTTLLGYVSRELDDEDAISRLGGQPEWIEPDNPPSAALAKCRACGDLMTLLLQLDGGLPDRFPGHERRLYVLACRKPKCSRKEGSIRALRSLRVSKEAADKAWAAEEAKRLAAEEEKKREQEEAEKKANAPGLGEALFGTKGLGGAGAVNPFASGSAGANPFSTGAGKVVAAANPFSTTPKEKKPDDTAKGAADLPKTFAETLTLNNSQAAQAQRTPPPVPEAWPEESARPKPYPALYLVDVDYETLDPTPLAVPANAHMEIDDTADGASGGGGSSIMAKDDFESAMDATFQKFADRMAQNPEQVIRYEFAGQPLLYSNDDAVAKALGSKGMPRCASCGAGRVFELQLTPHAITELEADEMSLEGMEWGTLMVGVCEKDCQAYGVGDEEVGYLEEWAGVQWEELVK